LIVAVENTELKKINMKSFIIVALFFLTTTGVMETITALTTSGLELQISAHFENILRDDIILNDEMIMMSRVKSKAGCARLCAEEKYCVTFTFNKVSRWCRGHSSLVTPTSSFTEDVGSQIFKITGELFFCISCVVCNCISYLLFSFLSFFLFYVSIF
jgi:hypothetical protein